MPVWNHEAIEKAEKEGQAIDKKRNRGRPSKWTPELETEFFDRMVNETVGAICASDTRFPAVSKVFLRVANDHGFRERYERAKGNQAEKIFNEILTIADDASSDLIVDEGGTKGNIAAVNRAKLRIETRKWILAKVMPKIYGNMEQVTVNHDVRVMLTDTDRAKAILSVLQQTGARLPLPAPPREEIHEAEYVDVTEEASRPRRRSAGKKRP